MNTLAKTLAGGSLALALGVSGAQAGVLAFGAYKNASNVTATERPVTLKTNGATTVAFTTKTNNTFVVVTYYASCYAHGEPGDYLSIRITVDGVDAHPRAGATFALCSAVDATNGVSAGVSRQAWIRVPHAGRHTMQVLARGIFVSGASRGILVNSSTVIPGLI